MTKTQARLLGAAAVTAAAVTVGLAGPASAIDADRRRGDWPDVLVASAKPEIHCLRVRTVPASATRPILYVPCPDDVWTPRLLPARPGLRCHRVRVVPILYVPCPDDPRTP